MGGPVSLLKWDKWNPISNGTIIFTFLPISCHPQSLRQIATISLWARGNCPSWGMGILFQKMVFRQIAAQDKQVSNALKQDRASVIAKVVPDAATKLIRSDEMGMLVARLVKASIIYGRCAAFEEVAKLKERFVMEKMAGYRPSSKQEYDQAGDDLANVSRANVFDFEGLMRGPSSPLRCFILLDNVNLGV
ncbi:hypothetical protein Tco_0756411 [Tanacetum coccineum]